MSEEYYTRDTCRLCTSRNLELVLPLTASPLCDAYVTEEGRNHAQEAYPLDLYLCRDCGYVFLPYVVNPEIIYRNYIYVTTSSLGLRDHFDDYADNVVEKIRAADNALVVDIGSNDGTLLQCFQSKGLRVLGIEPAKEIAANATGSGIETYPHFFDARLAEEIVNTHGPADVVTINNLFANIDDLIEMIHGVQTLLSENGVLIIESSYLADMIENMVFDFIYHEHLSYFSAKPLARFFAAMGLELYDLEHVPTKGGSLRYYIQRATGVRAVSAIVADMIAKEEQTGVDTPEIFRLFSKRITLQKNKLLDGLNDLKRQMKSIVGYGASATTTTLLHHFGIGGLLDCLIDDNPAKQHTYSPGLHIPVLSSQQLYEGHPDYAVVLAWRYFKPITEKHRKYVNEGGRFIQPLPVFGITRN